MDHRGIGVHKRESCGIGSSRARRPSVGIISQRGRPPHGPAPCPSPKPRPQVEWLICRSGSGHYLSSMITLLLHLVRLLPFLFGGHRQLALENLALRHQLSVYTRTMMRPKLRTTDRLFFSEAACQEHSSLVLLASSRSSSFVSPMVGRVSSSSGEVCHPSLRAVGGEWRLARA
jgi:hypothetical protein